jgi:patatin-like phospholipase/acyl hydrolase
MLNQKFYLIILTIFLLISLILIFFVIREINRFNQNQLVLRQKEPLNQNKNIQEESISLPPSPPEIKPYPIRLFSNRTEPTGYLVSKNNLIEITLENKDEKERGFYIKEFNIKDTLQPGEIKKYQVKIPNLKSGTKIEWKGSEASNEVLGYFIVN